MLGSVGSLSAAILAWYTIKSQKNKNKKDREPVLSPMIKKYEIENLTLDQNWDNQYALNNKWSDSVFKLSNFGRTSIIDIDYSYRLVNHKEIKEKLEKINRQYNSGDDNFLTSINKGGYYLESREPIDKNGKNSLSRPRLFFNVPGKHKSQHIHTLSLKADAIRPNEEIELLFPSYFILINNYELLLNADLIGYSSVSLNPIIELNIDCTDLEQNHWKIKYNLFLDNRFNINVKNKTSKFNFTVAFNHIETQKKN